MSLTPFLREIMENSCFNDLTAGITHVKVQFATRITLPDRTLDLVNCVCAVAFQALYNLSVKFLFLISLSLFYGKV